MFRAQRAWRLQLGVCRGEPGQHQSPVPALHPQGILWDWGWTLGLEPLGQWRCPCHGWVALAGFRVPSHLSLCPLHACGTPALLTPRAALLWHRKICKSCKCSQEEHGLSSELDEDRKVGGLLSGSRYSALTARPKGGDGARIYKRNRMIVTNPNISGKDPTFDTITYEWAPPGLTQKLVRAGEQSSALEKGKLSILVWFGKLSQ